MVFEKLNPNACLWNDKYFANRATVLMKINPKHLLISIKSNLSVLNTVFTSDVIH